MRISKLHFDLFFLKTTTFLPGTPLLRTALSNNEGYGILITGYSLGAGVCSLLAMDMMKKQTESGEIPPEVPIRCLSYGAPPVYECPEGTTHPNILSVVNNHDGLGISHN